MKKTFDDILTKIESPQYDALMNAISGFRVLIHALEDNADVQELIKKARSNKKYHTMIQQRLISQLEAEHDRQYTHPNDMVLATYYYILIKSDPENAQQIRDRLLSQPNLFWTAHLAQHLELVDDTRLSDS